MGFKGFQGVQWEFQDEIFKTYVSMRSSYLYYRKRLLVKVVDVVAYTQRSSSIHLLFLSSNFNPIPSSALNVLEFCFFFLKLFLKLSVLWRTNTMTTNTFQLVNITLIDYFYRMFLKY